MDLCSGEMDDFCIFGWFNPSGGAASWSVARFMLSDFLLGFEKLCEFKVYEAYLIYF